MPLQEALAQAQARRRVFEAKNQDYIENKVSKIFEPMIVHLLNS